MFLIKEYRKKAGLTQLQLAQNIGITREHLSLVENGHKKPSLTTLEKIAKELHTSIKDLIDEQSA